MMHGEFAEWDTMFLDVARAVATRSKDPSTKCGAVIVTPAKELVSTGYNGMSRKVVDALVDWSRPTKYRRLIHAELNAVLFGLKARGALGLDGCTMYCTGRLCSRCALIVGHVGISRVVMGEQVAVLVDDTEWALTIEILEQNGVLWIA